ncbi:uncharacterized protein LOC133186815 isoform X1 [Saccostrea echinata]|uniref:uncharacterized protein LOC133186815 isoform X1 n=1 Tax=Saccostrea echinata TaxID=191078 RepID=UPI002A82DB76|nr:uncharacterized protein LOC133186815 isoform X1 [Saccostrea echinata]
MGKHGFLWSVIYILDLILLRVVNAEEVGLLLFANGTSIQRSHLDGTQRHVIPLTNINKAKFVEFDPQGKQIYWADIGTREIWRTDLCGEEQERVYSLNATSSTYFISLALDYEQRTIYWTNTGYDIIERANLNGNRHMEIVNERISSPADLAIDISNGNLYWLDGGLWPKIERSQLDGSARRVVFDLQKDYPSALALDVSRQELYWNNKNDQSMWVGKTDGSGKRQLANKSVHSFPGMIGLSILDDYIYWENYYLKRIERMSTNNPKAVNIILKDVGDVQEVKAMKVEANDLKCAPGAPINISIMDVTNTTVTVTWEAGYDWGTSQNFRIERNTSTGWKLLSQSIPSNNRQTFNRIITGLFPNQSYQIRVKACNAVKGCNKEKFDVVHTIKTKGYPEVLVNPYVLNVTNTTATLTYKLPNYKQADLITLVVLIRKQGTLWKSLKKFKPKMRSVSGEIFVEVFDLQPRTRYEFLVRPCNAYGCNPRDPEILVVTTLGYPDLPRNLRVSKITNTSAKIVFSSDFLNTQTKIMINIESQGDMLLPDTPYTIMALEGRQRVEVDSLQPKTVYHVTLGTCNVYGCNPNQTKPFRFVTRGVPDRPYVFKVTNKTSSSVTLTWGVAYSKEEQFHEYSLQMAVNNENWTIISSFVSPDRGGLINYTYSELQENTRYSFKLSVCNVYGCRTDPAQTITLYSDGEDFGEADDGHKETDLFTSRDRLIIIIVSVVISLFIILVLIICVIKCAMRNKSSKDEYLHVKYNDKAAQI